MLTVRAHEAFSHKNKGWEQFTDRIIYELNNKETPVVFFKRDKDTNNWVIDREILKKIYNEIDGDATMGDIEQVLLSLEKNWESFLEDCKKEEK